MRILLFLLLLTQCVDCSCPDGFELVKDGQCRGFYGTIDVPYNSNSTAISGVELLERCWEMRGQPVIIHNDEQQEYWRRKVDKLQPDRLVLLGLFCDQIKQRQEWADRSIVDYKPPSYTQNLDQECGYEDSHNEYFVIDYTGYWDRFSHFHEDIAFDVYCTTQLQQPAGDGCDTFEDDNDDGVCYHIGAAASNWQDAQTICRNAGADLASIHNSQENSFVRRLAVSNGAVNGLFLGGTLSGKGNAFGWIDGSDWDYNNFYPGFPIDGLGECLIMDTLSTAGQWMNMNCSSNLPVACSRPRETVPTCTSGPWKEGQIMYSPGYPYDASVPCDYFLSVDAGKKVQVQVKFLEANSCCDHLILTDSYAGGKTIANLTGELTDKVYTSDTNFMRVTWQPNGGVNVRGMMMSFVGV